MARGGKRKGAGRPKYTEAQKKAAAAAKLSREIDRKFDEYLVKHNIERGFNPYGTSGYTLNKTQFTKAYMRAKNSGAHGAIRSIIRSERDYIRDKMTANRAAVAFNKAMRDYRKNGHNGNPDFDDLLRLSKGKTFTGEDFFRVDDIRTRDILDIIWAGEYWWMIGS